MLSSYFANYLPLSRHPPSPFSQKWPSRQWQPQSAASPASSHSTTTIYGTNLPLDSSSYQTHPYPGFGGLKSNGAAVNGTLFDEQRAWFSMSNLWSSSPASPHHHHSNNLQNFNNNNIIGQLSPTASTILNFLLPRKYHLSPENGLTVNTNTPTAETLHATNAWNNRLSPMPLSTSTTARVIDPYYDPMFVRIRGRIIRLLCNIECETDWKSLVETIQGGIRQLHQQ